MINPNRWNSDSKNPVKEINTWTINTHCYKWFINCSWRETSIMDKKVNELEGGRGGEKKKRGWETRRKKRGGTRGNKRGGGETRGENDGKRGGETEILGNNFNQRPPERTGLLLTVIHLRCFVLLLFYLNLSPYCELLIMMHVTGILLSAWVSWLVLWLHIFVPPMLLC